MSEQEFLGYAVLAIITIGSLIAVVGKLTQPINELRIVIQKLNDNIDMLKRDNETQAKKIDNNSTAITNLDNRVGKIETKISLYHKD
jgi:uncharacterized coiled-coil DUF342 family protein